MKYIKTFEQFLNEAKDSYIEVAVRDAKKSLNYLNDEYRNKFKTDGSNKYTFKNQDDAYNVLQDLENIGIEVIDTNLDESKINEAQSVDIMYALKAIKAYNKDSGEPSIDDLAEDIIKHLGYKPNKDSIEKVADHLDASSEHDKIPEDKDLIKEIYPLLESIGCAPLNESNKNIHQLRNDLNRLFKRKEVEKTTKYDKEINDLSDKINSMKKESLNEGKVEVIVASGRPQSFSKEDIKDMIDNYADYGSADNLPGWIYKAALRSKKFPKKEVDIKDLLTKILNHKGVVSMNLDTDKYWKNHITFEGLVDTNEAFTKKGTLPKVNVSEFPDKWTLKDVVDRYDDEIWEYLNATGKFTTGY